MQLHHVRAELEAAGARLVVIGNGAPNFIAGFRDKSGYDGELYTDPSLLAYEALGLRRGVGATFSLGAARRAVGAWRAGFRQSATRGSPWQQGGVFVIRADGGVEYEYESKYAGDHPPVADVLEAARRAAA